MQFLRLFSEQPDYFAAIVQRGKGGVVVAPNPRAVSPAALVQLVGSQVVAQVLRRGAVSSTAATDVMLLSGAAGRPPRLAMVAAVPGRPRPDSRIRPTFAAVYGIGIVDSFLRSFPARSGNDLSVIADGQVLASSIRTPSARRAVLAEALSANVEDADVSVQRNDTLPA